MNKPVKVALNLLAFLVGGPCGVFAIIALMASLEEIPAPSYLQGSPFALAILPLILLICILINIWWIRESIASNLSFRKWFCIGSLTGILMLIMFLASKIIALKEEVDLMNVQLNS